MNENTTFTTTGEKKVTTNLVSVTGYLCGVRKAIFENEHESLSMEIYNKLEKEKNARIIRNLCSMRESIMRNYGKIKTQLVQDHKPTSNIYEFPSEAMARLEEDGVYIFDHRNGLMDYLTKINKAITERIGNIKSFYPEWVSWPYIQEFFVMPGGTTQSGVFEALGIYNMNRYAYPYQTYINWTPKDSGNIFLHDRRFLNVLYEQHNDEFTDISRVQDISEKQRDAFNDFILGSDSVIFFVDCENADPYSFSATIKDMPEEVLKKIKKIQLCDDVHSSSAWQVLTNCTRIPVERILTERLLDHKSLVDVRLTAEICKAYYQDHVTSFVLSSSDSDYFALIESIPEARIFVLLEREKSSCELKNKLSEVGIKYCHADEFYSGDDDQLKVTTLLKEMKGYVVEHMQINAKEMFEQAQIKARTRLTEAEQDAFYQKWIKTMHLKIEEDGDVKISFGK